MSPFFRAGREWLEGLKGGWAFLLLRERAVQRFGTSRRDGLASFWVYAVLTPFWLVMGLSGSQPYFDHYHIDPVFYMGCQFLGTVLSVPLGLWLIWLFAKGEGVTEGYWRYVAASNWFALVSLFVFAVPCYGIVRYRLLDHREVLSLSTGLYAVTLVCQWFMAWRCLRASPFVAAGISILAPMAASIVSDYINLRFFGTAAPFEEPWFVDLYNAGAAY